MEAEQKNGICKWCGEEISVDELKSIDFGGLVVNCVCDFCYEEIKSEYGIVGDGDYFKDNDTF